MTNIKVGDKVRSKITGDEGKVVSIEKGYVTVEYWYMITSLRQDYFEEEYEKIQN